MFSLFGKRKQTPLLGIDISSTTVKLIEFSVSGDRFKVESYAVAPLPQEAVIEKNLNNSEQVSVSLSSAYAQSRTKNKTVCSAVPGSAVITKVLSMPSGLNDDDMISSIETLREMARRLEATIQVSVGKTFFVNFHKIPKILFYRFSVTEW